MGNNHHAIGAHASRLRHAPQKDSTPKFSLTVILPTLTLSPCCQEDAALLAILNGSTPHGPRMESTQWKWVAQSMGTWRTGKQCRDRYLNYLRGGIKKGTWTPEEENLLVDLYHVFGPRYVLCSLCAPHKETCFTCTLQPLT